MAIFDFPNSPVLDQTHEQNGVKYIYTGKVWNLAPIDPTNLEIALDRKVDVAGDNMIGHLGLPSSDPARNQAITRSWVENYYPQEAPHDGMIYARQAAEQVAGSAIIPLASDGLWVQIDAFHDAPHTSEAYARKDGYWTVVPEEAPREPDNVYGRCDGLWALTVSKQYVDDKNLEQDIMLDRKVNRGGDTMLDSLYLPPGDPVQGYEAVHKNYVDARTGVQEAPVDDLIYGRINADWERTVPFADFEEVRILNDRKVFKGGDEMTGPLRLPPGNPTHGYEAAHKNYVDTKVPEAPADGLSYVRINEGWQPLPTTLQDIPIMLDRKVDVAGDNMIGHLGLPTNDPARNQAITRSWVENYYTQEAPADGRIYARQAAEQVPGSAIIPLASDGIWVQIDPFIDAPIDGVVYGRKDGNWVEAVEEAERSNRIYARRDGLWAETLSKEDIDASQLNQDIAIDRKVNVGGDTMLDSLYLPPGDPVQGYEATHKNYVDKVAGRSVITELEPPPDVVDGALWWDEDSGGLYMYYDDGSSQQWVQVNGVGGASSTTFDSAPVNDTAYGLRNKQWSPVHSASIGDVKQGLQIADHMGWVKMDGRSVSTLTPSQQANAATLGITTNIPNANGAVCRMTGGGLGLITSGMTKSITIARTNLPSGDFTARDAGGHIHTTESNGGHTHVSYGTDGSDRSFDDLSTSQDSWGIKFKNDTVIFATADSDPQTRYIVNSVGGHVHVLDNTGVHSHAVGLEGNNTPISIDVTPLTLSVNMFLYLGYAALSIGAA